MKLFSLSVAIIALLPACTSSPALVPTVARGTCVLLEDVVAVVDPALDPLVTIGCTDAVNALFPMPDAGSSSSSSSATTATVAKVRVTRSRCVADGICPPTPLALVDAGAGG